MAGLGTRFINAGILEPKPLIRANNKRLIEHSVESLNIEAQYIFITRDYGSKVVNDELSELLKSLSPGCIEVVINKLTSGAAETSLYVKELINNENPLIITNCDQLINWNSNDFFKYVAEADGDGALVLFKSTDLKNSFAAIENHIVTNVVEKKQISDNALVGIHYWKHGKDFVDSTQKLIRDFRNNGSPECYVSETYNYLIKAGKKIIPYFLQKNGYVPLGTPEDIARYEGKLKEFYFEKPKTIFCDIDGTILKHVHQFSDVVEVKPELLNGVLAKFNDWDSKGFKIVLTTARKESAREITESHLNKLGLCWDILIMNVTSGNRYLINDKLMEDDLDRAVGINLITNSGFDTIDWGKYGL